MSKRFVIANDQIYDMYSLSNTDLRTKDGCLYRLDRCIGVIYEELDINELKAKAFDVIKDSIVFSVDEEDRFCECLIKSTSFWKDKDTEQFNLIKQALEVDEDV